MRKFINLLILLSFISCNPRQKTQNETVKIHQENIDSTDIKNEKKWKELRIVKSFIDTNKNISEKLLILEDALQKKEEICSDQELINLLTYRDQLYELIKSSGIIDDAYDQDGEPNFDGDSDDFIAELQYLGFYEKWSEGLFFGIEKGSFHEDLFSEKASEPLKLKTKLLNLLSLTHETAYPCFDLSINNKIINIGEKLLEKYPKHPYSKEILNYYNDAVNTLFDFHAVFNENGEIETYINFGYGTETIPGMTDIKGRENFIQNYPESKYANLLKKVLDNISSIEKLKDSLFFVRIENDSLNTEDYLSSGIDIIHSTEKFNAYRFYSDRKEAEDALKRIKKYNIDAYIYPIKLEKE